MRSAVGCAALVLALLAGCAEPRGATVDIKPGERPELASDEAGLWMEMERAENRLLRSGAIVHDANLHEYVRGVVCRLAGPLCGDVRVYVVRRAGFNAAMAPNGMMQVWTGLLLRTDNEAQLAYVLGHELGHYMRRHSLQMWREARSRAAGLAVFQAMVGVALGGAGQVAVAGSLAAFSRDNEREADELGFEAMTAAGYERAEAPKVWERLLQERAAEGKSAPSAFFATHPPTEERLASLRALAATRPAGGTSGEVGREALVAATRQLRGMLLNDELRTRRFAPTMVVLDHLVAVGDGLGELHFFHGELYRLRNGPGDDASAVAAYRKALEHPEAPAEAHRGLGVVLLRTGDRAGARAALARYLERRPDADDAAMIRAQLGALD